MDKRRLIEKIHLSIAITALVIATINVIVTIYIHH